MRHIGVPGVADVTVDDEGILSIVTVSGVVLDEVAMGRCVDAHVELAAGRRGPVLVDISGIRRMTIEARKIAASSRISSITTRLAVVSGSKTGALIGNFFLRVTRPAFPTRLFSGREEARVWLLEGEVLPSQ